jgi:hypothetical protein
MTITDYPLHRSGRAELPHPAPTLGDDAHAPEGIGVRDEWRRKPVGNQPRHAFPFQPLPLAAPPKRELPVAANMALSLVRAAQAQDVPPGVLRSLRRTAKLELDR